MWWDEELQGQAEAAMRQATSGVVQHPLALPPTKQPSTYQQGWQGGGKTWKRCDHVQEKFSCGYHTLLVTGGHDISKIQVEHMLEKGLTVPDMGVYLDNGWRYKLEIDPPALPSYPTKPSEPLKPKVEVFGSTSLSFDLSEFESDYQSELAAYQKALAKWEQDKEAYDKAKDERDKSPKDYRWPFMLVDWPDHGIINVALADKVVQFIRTEMKQGKVIDVGCAGAHGRTGTLLAMLLIDEEELHPAAAIRAVRKRHCDKCVESDSQIKAIFGFGGLTASNGDVKELR